MTKEEIALEVACCLTCDVDQIFQDHYSVNKESLNYRVTDTDMPSLEEIKAIDRIHKIIFKSARRIFNDHKISSETKARTLKKARMMSMSDVNKVARNSSFMIEILQAAAEHFVGEVMGE